MSGNNRTNFRDFTFFIFVMLAVFADSCYPQSGIAAPYLLEPPDARGRSLAGGGGAYASGAVAAFYNPAVLVTSGAISVNYGKPNFWIKTYGSDIPENIWLSAKIGKNSFCGVYCYYADYDYGIAIPEIMRLFKKYDLAIGGSVAYKIRDRSSLGLGVKFIHYEPKYFYSGQPHLYDNTTKSTVAFDFGYYSCNLIPYATIKYDYRIIQKLGKYFPRRDKSGLAFGISFTNLGPDFNYIDPLRKDPLPKQLRLSAGYQLLESDLIATRVTIDGSKMLYDINDQFSTEIREITWTFGIEASVLYLVTFRAGEHLDKIGEDRYGAYGIGIGPEWLHLDYSHIGHDQSSWRDNQESWSIYCNIPAELLR